MAGTIKSPFEVSSKVKLQRKCCNTTTLNASRCKSVEWKPNGDKLEVGAFAKKNLQCQKDDAILQDIKAKNSNNNQLILEVCCLDYNSNSEMVICSSRAPIGGKGDAAAVAGIGAAIALPLALGIGIPLLLLDCEIKFTVLANTIITISSASATTITQYDGVGKNECCSLCDKLKANACGWDSSATLAANGITGPDACFVFIGPFTTQADPTGSLAFIRK